MAFRMFKSCWNSKEIIMKTNFNASTLLSELMQTSLIKDEKLRAKQHRLLKILSDNANRTAKRLNEPHTGK